jgi:hypothetical protein
MLVLLAARALAADIVDYSEDFDTYAGATFTGTDGWQSYYAADSWSTLLGGTVYALTDDSTGTWGSGEAMDNHLVYTSATWSDFTLDATIHSDDDDTMGLSFRFQDEENFYLLFFVGGGFYPDTGAGTTTNTTLAGARLYKVVLGSATLLASSATTYTQYATHDVRIVASGGAITVYFDDDRNGVYEPADLLLSATDSTFSDGYVGLYCFNNGEYAGAGCAFDDLVVSIPDTDADGIADERDDCPADANADQADLDGDGDGDVCDTDADGDGYPSIAAGGTDCDDTLAAVSPVATETCATTADDDCDGSVNDEGAVGCTTRYLDADGDSWGADTSSCACAAAGSYRVLRAGDCDDTTATVSPDAIEVCNGIDDDCDTTVDIGATDATTRYTDADGDGYGNPGSATLACDTFGVADGTDCDDTDASIFPGAEERLNDRDDDCDGDADDGLDTGDSGDTGSGDTGSGGTDSGETDSGVPDDTGVSLPDDTGESETRIGGFWGGSACDTSGGASAWLGVLAGLLIRRRR